MSELLLREVSHKLKFKRMFGKCYFILTSDVVIVRLERDENRAKQNKIQSKTSYNFIQICQIIETVVMNTFAVFFADDANSHHYLRI